MRRAWAIPSVAAVLIAVASDVGGARTASVRIASAPSVVMQERRATVVAVVSPRTARCAAFVRPASGSQGQRLGAKRARRGRVRWSWTVPANAATGRWRITVSCRGAGRATRAFSVARRTIPARVEIVRSGFSQSAPSEFRRVNYGLVLMNRSPDEAALDVRLTVNFVDASNRVIDTNAYTLDFIPAGGTFNFGQSEFDVTATVARLEVAIAVGESRPEARPVLSGENVRIEERLGTATLVGEVRNTADRPLSSIARISAVAFDRQGNVVGGGRTYPESAVEPGFRVGFEIDLDPIEPARIASFAVSVESAFRE